MMTLFLYTLCGAVGLAALEMIGLRLLSNIPIGEDFLRGGQGYVEYVRYWRHIGITAVVGTVLGLIVYWIAL